MPIVHRVLVDLGVVVSTFTGPVGDEELLASYEGLYGGSEWRPGFHELVDLRACDMQAVTADGLRKLSSLAERSVAGRAGSFRTAVLAGNDLSYGLVRMYGTYADPLSEDVHVCRDPDEALDWLGVSASDRPRLLALLAPAS